MQEPIPLPRLFLFCHKHVRADYPFLVAEEIAQIEEATTRHAFDEKAKVLYRGTAEAMRIGDDNAIKLPRMEA